MPDAHDAPAEVIEALAALSPPRPMRRGSLSARRMKCNKPGCPCAEDPDRRHGPYLSLTRGVAGRTRSRLLSAEQAESARAQVAAGKQFRAHVGLYWQACERWADAELEAAAETEAVQRGGSRTPSMRTSAPRSRRS